MRISCALPLVIIPLFSWASLKEENPCMGEQGPEIINFQISMMIRLFAGAMLVFAVMGSVIPPIMGIFIVTIINAIKVAVNQDYSYPFCIKFIKIN